MRRTWLLLAALALAMLVALFPMRVALGGLADNGVVGIRKVTGPVWMGHLEGVTVGEIVLGDFRASLSPWQLLLLRGSVDLRSVADPTMNGTLFGGVSQWGMRDMDARLALAGAFAPLPVESLELKGAAVRFSGEDCAEAGGQVRLSLRGSINGVDVASTLTGPLRCDGKAVSALLVSGSAMERVALRITAKGGYAARLNLRAANADAALKLTQVGFRETPLGHELAVNGTF